MRHDEPLFEYVLRRLTETRGQHRRIAEASGVPYSTLIKIHQRYTTNPGIAHVQALADALRAIEDEVAA